MRIPDTLTTRLKTIFSDNDTLKIKYQELKDDLLEKGFLVKVTGIGVENADAKNRTAL